MPTIYLETHFSAPINICFDASRNIDIHKKSMAHTGEQAIAGVTSGLIGLGETVTWKAKHFGITQKLMVKIKKIEPSNILFDKMVSSYFNLLLSGLFHI